ncbi:hypothetical protein O6H91_Y507300 [Diphasiastrum complanatum]|nr:hypothetical protein O6H91_Y507300 [Diphasiastrum complanatum]
MPSGLIFAVKKLRLSDDESLQGESSLREIETAGNVRHRNILRLFGYFHSGESEILVYEFLENGSLGDLLHRNPSQPIPWEDRYRVALGTAQGLEYLHHDCVPTIIHRDIKANNILLDGDMEPCIGDFGLAKLVDKYAETMSSIAGSYGYIAPEFGYTLRVTEKCDIYSFGVVLLELLCRRLPVDPCFSDGMDIVSWIKRKMANDNYTFALDPLILKDCSDLEREEIGLVLKIALFCANEKPDDRPTMRQVVEMLRRTREHEEINPAKHQS